MRWAMPARTSDSVRQRSAICRGSAREGSEGGTAYSACTVMLEINDGVLFEEAFLVLESELVLPAEGDRKSVV